MIESRPRLRAVRTWPIVASVIPRAPASNCLRQSVGAIVVLPWGMISSPRSRHQPAMVATLLRMASSSSTTSGVQNSPSRGRPARKAAAVMPTARSGSPLSRAVSSSPSGSAMVCMFTHARMMGGVSPTPRMITLGETMALITPAHAEPLRVAREVRLLAGGAESNVAMHAAQLGVPTAWVSAVGDDALGVRVCDEVAGRGVDTRWVTVDPDAPTGVYFKDPGHGVLYYRRGSAAARMSPASVAGVPLEDAEVVHLSGITPALSASCAALIDAVVDRVAAGPGTLAFDVNHRAALWAPGAAASALLPLARRADLVFV